MGEKIKVLIIDDAKPFSDELKMMFETPSGEDDYEFEVSQAFNLDEACHCLKGFPLHWNVFIIDRRFQEKRNGNDFWSILILESLIDLFVKGIKIVLTAYPEKENMRRCFQLEAWDYIDKKSMDEETCFEKTILSSKRGLKFQERFKVLYPSYIKALDWYDKNRKDFKEYRGKFVALKLIDKEKNQWEIMKKKNEEPFSQDSMYRLYGDLDSFYNETDKLWEEKTRNDIVIISIS